MNHASLLLALLVLTFPLSAGAQQPGQTYTARVVEVTDGDTYDVRVSEGQTFTVRLWGIDAPESSQPYGSDATSRGLNLLILRGNGLTRSESPGRVSIGNEISESLNPLILRGNGLTLSL